MIKIELMTGEVLENDPQYGMNLDNAAEITVCLETSDYRWTGPGGRFEVLGAADVKRIYGDEDSPVAENRYERATRELAKALDIPISPDIDSKRAKWGDAYSTLAQHARAYNVPIPAVVTDIINGRA